MSPLGDKIRAAIERTRARQGCAQSGKIKRADPSPSPEPIADSSFRTAIADMADKTFCLGIKYGDQQWRADRFKAHPDILEFERCLVKRLRVLDVPLFAHCIWRKEEEQEAAFKAGHSKARWGESPHNFGCAVDIIHGTKAWNLTERQWAVIGHIGKELAVQKSIKVTWGGDFRSLWDPAHWELRDWRTRLADGK